MIINERPLSKWSSHNADEASISGYASITLDYTTPHSHDILILLNHNYGWVATISSGHFIHVLFCLLSTQTLVNNRFVARPIQDLCLQ